MVVINCPWVSDEWMLFIMVVLRRMKIVENNRKLTTTLYIRCIYGMFCRDFIKFTAIHGVYVRLWPTLQMSRVREYSTA